MKQGIENPHLTHNEAHRPDREQTCREQPTPTEQGIKNPYLRHNEAHRPDRGQTCREQRIPTKQLLDNPLQTPDESHLRMVMGGCYAHFETLCALLDRLGATRVWNYYKDGKNWLCKVQYRGKTVLWLSVWEQFFRLSFFFNEKTRAGVTTLDINPALRTAFQEQTVTGKLFPLLLDIRSGAELADAEKLIIYKIS